MKARIRELTEELNNWTTGEASRKYDQFTKALAIEEIKAEIALLVEAEEKCE